jgi:DNA-binding transcriptional regulator YbjK
VAGEGRRALIADTAIATLAERGSRGLTHRAVDEAAGLPMGSTSYYLRRRADLLAAAADRLADLDTAALAALPGRSAAADLTRLLEGALHGEGRDRTIARYELSLEAARRDDLRAVLVAGTVRVHAAVRELLGALGAAQPDTAADDLLALLDGLLLAEVTGTGRAPRGRRELRAVIERFLGSVKTGSAG